MATKPLTAAQRALLARATTDTLVRTDVKITGRPWSGSGAREETIAALVAAGFVTLAYASTSDVRGRTRTDRSLTYAHVTTAGHAYLATVTS